MFDGELLGRKTKGVITHWVQDVVTAHAQESGVDVGGNVAERVADVQAHTAGVREHVQHVELRLGRVELRIARLGSAKGLLLDPVLLPLRL